jgi:hypothetical protein
VEPKPLTGKQAVGDQRTTQAVQIFKKKARIFKRTLFARCVHTHKNVFS